MAINFGSRYSNPNSVRDAYFNKIKGKQPRKKIQAKVISKKILKP